MIKKFAITAFALSMTAAFAGSDKATSASTSSAQNSVAVETSASRDSMVSAPAGDSQVKQVQQALKDKGQDPGPIDGKMGPKTQAALQSFQSSQGLSGSGSLDQRTLAALGISGGASASASSSTSSNQPSASSDQPASSANSTASSSNQPAASNQPTASSNQPSSNQPAASSNQSSSANSSSTNSTKQ